MTRPTSIQQEWSKYSVLAVVQETALHCQTHNNVQPFTEELLAATAAPQVLPLVKMNKVHSDSDTTSKSSMCCQGRTKEQIVSEVMQILSNEQVPEQCRPTTSLTNHILWDHTGFLDYRLTFYYSDRNGERMDWPSSQLYAKRVLRTEGSQLLFGNERQAKGCMQRSHGPFSSNGRGHGRGNGGSGRGHDMSFFSV